MRSKIASFRRTSNGNVGKTRERQRTGSRRTEYEINVNSPATIRKQKTMKNEKNEPWDVHFSPPSWFRQVATLAFSGTLAALATGCNVPQLDGTDGTDPKPDGTFTAASCEADSGAPSLPEGYDYGWWKRVELNDVAPGNDYVCANGEPYQFFVKFNEGASDLVVTLEGGGACWDYQTCNHEAGVLMVNTTSPAPDDYMDNLGAPVLAMHPQFGRIDNGVPTNKYNQVFLPYCTADVYAGDLTKTYTRANSPDLVRHHRGRHNMKGIAEYLEDNFGAGKTGQLLTMGTSAGGVGTLVNYGMIREAVDPTCGAGINDAGPIFPPGGEQSAMIDILVDAWDLDGLIAELDDQLTTDSYRELRDDFGNISHGLSKTYPDDRFMLSAFKEDLNFSVFSFAGSGVVPRGASNFTEQVLQKWDSELGRFQGWAWSQPENNWGFYFPVFRKDLCSHGVAPTAVSKAHDSAYRSDGIAGRAHGYTRTEVQWDMTFEDLVWDENGNAVVESVVRRRHFGDAISQLLDPSKSVPRYVDYRQWDQLTFMSQQGVGKTSEIWYEDVSGSVISDPQDWVNRQSDPNWCPVPGSVDQCSCANIGSYDPPNH